MTYFKIIMRFSSVIQ